MALSEALSADLVVGRNLFRHENVGLEIRPTVGGASIRCLSDSSSANPAISARVIPFGPEFGELSQSTRRSLRRKR